MIILLVIQFSFSLLIENYYHFNEFSWLITWDSNMEGHINKRKKAFDVRQQKIWGAQVLTLNYLMHFLKEQQSDCVPANSSFLSPYRKSYYFIELFVTNFKRSVSKTNRYYLIIERWILIFCIFFLGWTIIIRFSITMKAKFV